MKGMAVTGLLLAWTALFAHPGEVSAQNGWYLGMELDAALVPGMSVDGSDNDWSTKCDRFSNPAQLETDASCDVTPPRAEWRNDVDGGTGMLAGVVLGYRNGRLRIEGEYFYRTATYGGAVQTVIGDEITLDKADQELEEAVGGVDDVMAHNLFANLYYELSTDSRYTPYVGVGAGMSFVSMDYFMRWKRNDLPSRIDTFENFVLRAQIAGTTSLSDRRLSDLLVGYQAIAGVDYELGGGVTLGFKVRWTGLGEFEDEAQYTQLRSHESTVGRGFFVVYRANTSGLSSLGGGLSMKYRLG